MGLSTDKLCQLMLTIFRENNIKQKQNEPAKMALSVARIGAAAAGGLAFGPVGAAAGALGAIVFGWGANKAIYSTGKQVLETLSAQEQEELATILRKRLLKSKITEDKQLDTLDKKMKLSLKADIVHYIRNVKKINLDCEIIVDESQTSNSADEGLADDITDAIIDNEDPLEAAAEIGEGAFEFLQGAVEVAADMF